MSRGQDVLVLKQHSPGMTEAVLMWALACLYLSGLGSRHQKPLPMALSIHKPDPAPSPQALAQPVPHVFPYPPLSRSLPVPSPGDAGSHMACNDVSGQGQEAGGELPNSQSSGAGEEKRCSVQGWWYPLLYDKALAVQHASLKPQGRPPASAGGMG